MKKIQVPVPMIPNPNQQLCLIMNNMISASEMSCDNCIIKIGDEYKYYSRYNARLYRIRIVGNSEDEALVYFIICEDESIEINVNLFNKQKGISWGIATNNMKLIVSCTEFIEKLSDYIFNTQMTVYYIRPVFKPNPMYNRHNRKNILSEYKVVSINKFFSFPYPSTVRMIGDFCEITHSNTLANTLLIDKIGDTHKLKCGEKLLCHNENYMIIYYKCPIGVRGSIPSPYVKWKERLRDSNLRSLPIIGLYHYNNFNDPIFSGHYTNMEFANSKILLVQREKKYGFIDVEGNEIVPIKLDPEKILFENKANFIEWNSISECGLLAIHNCKEDKDHVGFINKEGRLVIPIDFDKYKEPFSDGTIKLLKGDIIFTMNFNGEVICSENRFIFNNNERIDNW